MDVLLSQFVCNDLNILTIDRKPLSFLVGLERPGFRSHCSNLSRDINSPSKPTMHN